MVGKMRLTFDEYNDLEEKLLGIDDEVYVPTKQELQRAEMDMEQYGLYLLWLSLKCTGPRSAEEQEIIKEVKKAVNRWIVLIDEEEEEASLLSLTPMEFDTLTDVLLERIPFHAPFIPTKKQLAEMEADLDHYGLFLLWIAGQDQQPEEKEQEETLGKIDFILDRAIEIADEKSQEEAL